MNQKDDFLHFRLSRYYEDNHDVVAVEDLKTRNMGSRGNPLAPRMLDASWDKLLQLLPYKAERADRVVVKVNLKTRPKNTDTENWIETTTLL